MVIQLLNTAEFRLSNTLTMTRCGLVADGKATQDEWREVGKLLAKIHCCAHWIIGDWLNYGMEQYRLTYEEAIEVLKVYGFTFTSQTLRNDKYVASRIPLSWRHDKLTWQHHKEVAPLDSQQQKYWLSYAEEMELTTKKLRLAISHKKNGLPWLRFSDVWEFSACDERFGVKSRNRIPGQIIQNLLYRYTKIGSFVIDPTAQDGTTLDVCTKCDEVRRDCLAFDVNPNRPNVLRSDATKPWPTTKQADLVFVNATCGSLLGLEQDFKLTLRKILGNATYHLSENGILGIIIAPHTITNLYEDLTWEVIGWLKHEIGLEYLRRIQVPTSARQITSNAWANAKRNSSLVAQVRDLLIFRLKQKKSPISRGRSRFESISSKCYYCGISIGPHHLEIEGYMMNGKLICSHCLALEKKNN